MSNAHGLHALMLQELHDLYDAEQQLVKALPKLAKGASSSDLRDAITTHLAETKGHVERLEQAFGLLGERATGKHCTGIAGIIDEGADLLSSDFAGAVKDAGIVAGAQRAEHYEIGAYGAVLTWARVMGHDDLASLLHETLEEEKAADEKLTQLAEGGINDEAAAEANPEMANGQSARPVPSKGRKPAARSRADR
jgi:ferritin-like metal-binding protein YciE